MDREQTMLINCKLIALKLIVCSVLYYINLLIEMVSVKR